FVPSGDQPQDVALVATWHNCRRIRLWRKTPTASEDLLRISSEVEGQGVIYAAPKRIFHRR
ncbi:MAG: hypothetical protein L6437_00595, partial [Kiritimatiellae bacterium]|nr:hypothetical protein [Kiritimatiellia bacterium]